MVLATLHRIIDWVLDSRRRQAQRTIERHIDNTPGRFSDSAEREINNRFLDSGWKFR